LNTIVYYHKNCKDGLSSAYAAYTAFGDNAMYIPLSYGYENTILRRMEQSHRDSDIYFLDFSIKKDAIENMAQLANSVTIVDHHLSAEKNLCNVEFNNDNIHIHINKEHSGGVLAWEFFNKSKDIPEIYKYIEDIDLLKYSLEDINAFEEGMKEAFIDNDIQQFGRLIKNKDIVSLLIELGKPLVSKKQKEIEQEALAIIRDQEKFIKKIDGREFYVVNYTDATRVTDLSSAIMGMSNRNIPVATYFIEEDKVFFSLRSTDDIGEIETVAEKLGGGGHPTCSAFRIALDELNRLLNDNILIDRDNAFCQDIGATTSTYNTGHKL